MITKRAVKTFAEIAERELKRLQYLPALYRGKNLDRSQKVTRENYEMTWQGIASRLPNYYSGLHVMLVDGKIQRVPLYQLINRYLKAQRDAIYDLKGQRLRILEVGAGYGQILYSLAASMPQHEFQGVEYSDAGVRTSNIFSKQSGDIQRIAGQTIYWPITNVRAFIQGDGKALPYPDNYFDVSYTSLVLEQIPKFEDQSQVFQEMRRVTKKLCCFLEPWKEAQGVLDRAYLTWNDYFQESISVLPFLGYKNVQFKKLSSAHNLRYRLGFVTAEPAK